MRATSITTEEGERRFCQARARPPPQRAQRPRIGRASRPTHPWRPSSRPAARPDGALQKCNKLHPLDAFDGPKRTCIKLLEQHNTRRRDAYAKRKTEGGNGAVRGRGGGRGKRAKASGEAILLAAEMLSGDAPAVEAEAGAEAAPPAGMLAGWLQTHSANPAAPEAVAELVASAQADPATMSALLSALNGAPPLAESLP